MTGVYPEPSSLHLRKLTDWGKAERTMIAYEAKRTKVPAEIKKRPGVAEQFRWFRVSQGAGAAGAGALSGQQATS